MRTPSELKRKANLSPGSLCVLGGLLFALSTPIYSVAQQPPQREKRGGPPPEAFAACESAAKNDACFVDTKRGTMTGTCQLDRRKKETLLCVPTDRQEKPKRQQKAGHNHEHGDGETVDQGHDAP